MLVVAALLLLLLLTSLPVRQPLPTQSGPTDKQRFQSLGSLSEQVVPSEVPLKGVVLTR